MNKEKQNNSKNIYYWFLFFICIYLVIVIKIASLEQINNLFFYSYSLLISVYLLSRFIFAYLHNPDKTKPSNYEPTVAFAIPSKNEEANIRETIIRIAKSDYPKNKFEIIAVNDGSSDRTLIEMLKAKKIAKRMGVKVKVFDWKKNHGKREGMAKCIKNTHKEVVIFIDSDSFVKKNTARELVKYFQDSKVAAVAGQAYVANPNDNFLTKMQSARYYISFRAFKSAESLFGTVTCCSGCCAAYRKSYLDEVVDDWLNQKFLGVKCTYGDDRSLTNALLAKGYDTLFTPDAVAYTFVPNNLKQFLKQQLRWKKSWTRESFNAAKFIWKRNPIASISFYLGFILPFIAPIVALRAFIWYPFTTGFFPFYYVSGLLMMAIIYGVYYRIYTKDKNWFWGAIFTIFYTLVLMWQLPYAILTLKDSRWGTR